MASMLHTARTGFGFLLRDLRLRAVAVVATVVTAAVLFALPVLLTPGNTFAFQFSILTARDVATIAVLAVLTGLLTAAHVGLRRTRCTGTGACVARTAVGGVSSAFVALLGTAACASCVATILGFLGIGFGSTLFLLRHRTAILTVVLALLAFALIRSLQQLATASGDVRRTT